MADHVKHWRLAGIYILAMVAANILVWIFGPWSSPIIAFVLIGLDLTLRDIMHEHMSRLEMVGIILVGGAITWGVNPAAAQIAVASGTAFTLAALADWAVYSWLYQHDWLVRSNGSNVVGAAIDSIAFPTIAFGVFLPEVILLQFLAKVGGGALWTFLWRPRRSIWQR